MAIPSNLTNANVQVNNVPLNGNISDIKILFAKKPIWVNVNSISNSLPKKTFYQIFVRLNSRIEGDFIKLNDITFRGVANVQSASDFTMRNPAAFVEKFNQHIAFKDSWVATYQAIGPSPYQTKITITSKFYGEKYKLERRYYGGTNDNIVEQGIPTGRGTYQSEDYDNYGIFCEIWHIPNKELGSTQTFTPDGVNHVLLGTVQRNFVVDNNYTFDVSSIVQNLFTDKTLQFNTQVFQNYLDIKNFYLKIGQIYSDGASVYRNRKYDYVSPLFWGKEGETPIYNTAVLDKEFSTSKLLSNQPETKTTSSNNEFELINYIFDKDIVDSTKLYCAVKFTYSDLSEETVFDKFTNNFLTSPGTYYSNVSYKNVYPFSNPDKTIIEYGIAIGKTGSQIPVTPYQTYKLNENCEDVHGLIFLNKLGGWDSIELSNEFQNSVFASYGFINKQFNYNTTKTDFIKKNTKVNLSKGLSVSTKTLTKDEFIWLEDLAVTEQCYYISTDKQILPVVIEQLEMNYDESSSNNTIKLRLSFSQNG